MTKESETGATRLNALRIFSDRLSVNNAGMMVLDGLDAKDLLDRFGSPLVVTIERTLLDNFRRLRKAFETNWNGPVRVLYSIKSNNTLAIRYLLSQAGAGGDCFGAAELKATLDSGANPAGIALNGSDKSLGLIRQAIEAGVTINVDGEDEIEFIRQACGVAGKRARVNLRLKVLPEALSPFMSGSSLKHGTGINSIKRAKWGFIPETARQILAGLLALPEIDMLGFSCHIGHLSNRPEAFAAIADSFGVAVRTLSDEAKFRPSVLDLGGGWAREREPEQLDENMQRFPIEAQASAACAALAKALGPLAGSENESLPELWVEPGRYISGNAQVLLATVGAIKEDAGYRWVHIDASTNDLQRIETGGFYYHLLPANRMHAPYNCLQEFVGGTCFRSVIGAGRPLPSLVRGDIVAILDAGMYAEVFANQFNSIPRPAAVLVGPDRTVEVIRERETISDVFAQHRLPDRLTSSQKE